MSTTIQERGNTVFVTVDFVLHPEKQHTLIYLLMAHSPISLVELAKLLNVSIEKLINVISKVAFLTQAEATQLAKYFCVFCGS